MLDAFLKVFVRMLFVANNPLGKISLVVATTVVGFALFWEKLKYSEGFFEPAIFALAVFLISAIILRVLNYVFLGFVLLVVKRRPQTKIISPERVERVREKIVEAMNLKKIRFVEFDSFSDPERFIIDILRSLSDRSPPNVLVAATPFLLVRFSQDTGPTGLRRSTSISFIINRDDETSITFLKYLELIVFSKNPKVLEGREEFRDIHLHAGLVEGPSLRGPSKK
ncbi:MAG: hypothetical protein ACE5DI_00420 [Candidatus Micrarchaeia archaeon]